MSEPTQDDPRKHDPEEGDPAVADELDTADDEAVIDALAGLRRQSAASPDFTNQLEEKIRVRSAGRFFGRPSLADRVWITVLALIVLVLGAGLYLLISQSDTGSLRFEESDDAPELAPGAREALPKP